MLLPQAKLSVRMRIAKSAEPDHGQPERRRSVRPTGPKSGANAGGRPPTSDEDSIGRACSANEEQACREIAGAETKIPKACRVRQKTHVLSHATFKGQNVFVPLKRDVLLPALFL